MTIIAIERGLLVRLASVLDGKDQTAIEQARRTLRQFYREVL